MKISIHHGPAQTIKFMELILKHSYSRKTNKKGNIEGKLRNETFGMKTSWISRFQWRKRSGGPYNL